MKLEKDNDITKSNVSLKEGDTICLNFRGNISSMTSYKRIFRFYGIHGIDMAWTIGVVDKFAQRSLNMFCGYPVYRATFVQTLHIFYVCFFFFFSPVISYHFLLGYIYMYI